MIAKEKRLNLKKDFKWVAKGKVIQTKFAKLFISLGGNNFPKVGIATSAAVFKKAVERNRARRIVSAAIETLYTKLPPNSNMVALPKSSILAVKSDLVLLDLEEALKHGKIIN